MSTRVPYAVFIGSSSEGRDVAQALATGLARAGCEPTVWDQEVFDVSTYTLPSLVKQAHRSDFALLVATPDDVVESRDVTQSAPRDNVILEYGLFVGALGVERVFVLATEQGMKLPSDLLGLTRLPYTPRVRDSNLAAAVAPAVDAVRHRTANLGLRPTGPLPPPGEGRPSAQQQLLRRELDTVALNARAQGWRVRTNSDTTLRLVARSGRKLTFQVDLDRPDETRMRLRAFISEVRATGLRVNASARRRLASG